jgi:hypothetical protein
VKPYFECAKLPHSLKVPSPKSQISRTKVFSQIIPGILSLEFGIWDLFDVEIYPVCGILKGNFASLTPKT